MTINNNPSINVSSVGIIGCGWLGTELAKSLINKGVNVFATTRTEERQQQILAQGIQCELLNLNAEVTDFDEKADTGTIDKEAIKSIASSQVFTKENLVICITPQFKKGKKNYPANIKTILLAAKDKLINGNIKKVILISSTGVYKNLSGRISEKSVIDLSDDKVKALALAEDYVKQFCPHYTVIRFGGLVGRNRHPGRFLAGKQDLANADEKVNLIHQDDAVAIIEANLFKTAVSGIFNGVSDTKSTREVFYQKAAKSLGLLAPKFLLQNAVSLNNVANKSISNDKIKTELNYQFIYPDLAKSFDIY
ncbi:MAG: NAD(P)H-binding protein [Colwellia sp.]